MSGAHWGLSLQGTSTGLYSTGTSIGPTRTSLNPMGFFEFNFYLLVIIKIIILKNLCFLNFTPLTMLRHSWILFLKNHFPLLIQSHYSLRCTMKFDGVFDKIVINFPTAHTCGDHHAHYLGSPYWKISVNVLTHSMGSAWIQLNLNSWSMRIYYFFILKFCWTLI